MKSDKKKPDIQILQNRYFTVNDLRDALRKLKMGIDNAEFKRLWNKEVVCPPDVLEPQVVLWRYGNAIQLIKDIYKLKGREDEYDIYKVDEALIEVKEIKRYRIEMVPVYAAGKYPSY